MRYVICDSAFMTRFCNTCKHAYKHTANKDCKYECKHYTDADCISWKIVGPELKFKSFVCKLLWLLNI